MWKHKKNTEAKTRRMSRNEKETDSMDDECDDGFGKYDSSGVCWEWRGGSGILGWDRWRNGGTGNRDAGYSGRTADRYRTGFRRCRIGRFFRSYGWRTVFFRRWDGRREQNCWWKHKLGKLWFTSSNGCNDSAGWLCAGWSEGKLYYRCTGGTGTC